ncbi:hypothetical protein [Streptomyces sp. NPDC001568]|uniref:hypothetical protein n=1 Tax=Streptomyces sp. NPDC001568 TaxID=3364588 RepID=UPI0036BE2975
MDHDLEESPVPLTASQERLAATRTLAAHAADAAELAGFLDMLDLQDPDSRRPNPAKALQAFNIPLSELR